ncbi:centrosomal protein of 44 kDa isoform X2 [Danio aesculapii]|uniref:centrosomal protein of 44 kDa isoform X2 n=1 Tax=Danio aesculapii TaxID=1142201 RepID=UPI0024BFDF7F|nr:centrosomal protein of 44 kDa isoform X2 [Danio aesculapii]
MATGDLKGCLRKLEASLRSLKYPRDVDYQRLAVGDPSACLPIVSFAFTSFSPSLAEHLVDFGVELTGMNDLRFIENVYKVLRDVFSYKPLLTKQQFLQFGFAERKVSILCDVIGLALSKHKELTKDSKHLSKPKRRPVLKSCVKNEIPSDESNSLELTALMVPQKQPLVERHLGSSSAAAQIRCFSDEHPLQEEESDKELESEHLEDLSQPAESTECVLESRLRVLEEGLLETVGRLEQRLALMEHRIHALEKSLAGKIIIESNQWENLESRVLLLETRLALTSAQGLTSGNGVFNTENVSANGSSAGIETPVDNDNGNIITSPSPTASQNFKERLDRIVYMMKDTSDILKNIEPTM